MILGRNAGLWAGLIQAGINLVAAVFVVVVGHDPTVAETAVFVAANAFGAVTVALIANSSDQGTLPTFAPTTVERRKAIPASSVVPPAQAPDQLRRKDDQAPTDSSGTA